jgi:(2Fe-2S) ferredoxin
MAVDGEDGDIVITRRSTCVSECKSNAFVVNGESAHYYVRVVSKGDS